MLKELIFIISGIALFVLLLYFRVSLKAIIFRIIYGDYHIKYLSMFYKEDSYYNSYYPSKSSLYNQISNIKNAILRKNKTHTELPLYFQNIEYGISSKKLISLIGKPVSHDVISLGSEKIVSLEYNLDQYNIIDKYVYYFRNDKYYLGEFHFNKVKEETTNEILKSINTKYKTHFDGHEAFVIRNKNGNLLQYQDLGFRIAISYFNENCENINYLLNFKEQYKLQRKNEYEYHPNIQQITF